MNAVTAAAVRRGTILAGALATTMCAHTLGGADVGLLPIAPGLWLAIVALGVMPGLAGRGARGFVAWGPWRLAGALVAAQLVAHAALTAAPWALGLSAAHVHGHAIAPLAIGVHVVAALLLTLALTAGERWVTAALSAVGRLLAPAPPRRGARAPERIGGERPGPRPATPRGPRSSRGPPALLTRTA
jgi:hypothetical protein